MTEGKENITNMLPQLLLIADALLALQLCSIIVSPLSSPTFLPLSPVTTTALCRPAGSFAPSDNTLPFSTSSFSSPSPPFSISSSASPLFPSSSPKSFSLAFGSSSSQTSLSSSTKAPANATKLATSSFFYAPATFFSSHASTFSSAPSTSTLRSLSSSALLLTTIIATLLISAGVIASTYSLSNFLRRIDASRYHLSGSIPAHIFSMTEHGQLDHQGKITDTPSSTRSPQLYFQLGRVTFPLVLRTSKLCRLAPNFVAASVPIGSANANLAQLP